MRSRDARGVITRDTRHDYGIFWSGSWRKPRGSTGAGAYIDAAHGGWDYAITVKVMSGTSHERLAIYNAAMELGRPSDDWEPARRRRSESFGSGS
jgi:hypothetical protein